MPVSTVAPFKMPNYPPAFAHAPPSTLNENDQSGVEARTSFQNDPTRLSSTLNEKCLRSHRAQCEHESEVRRRPHLYSHAVVGVPDHCQGLLA